MTLDEPKGTTENTAEKQASAEGAGTPKKTPKLFTEEQVEEAKQLERIKAGREEKALEAREGAVKEALAKAEGLQASIKKAENARVEREDREALERAGDDPLARSKVELSQQIRRLNAELGDTKTELGKREEELTDTRKVVAESTKERNAREIASKYEVDYETLKLMDVSVEVMEAWAQKVSGKEPKTLKPDGSKTSMGSASFERIRDDMIKNPSNDAKMKRYIEAKKAREG